MPQSPPQKLQSAPNCQTEPSKTKFYTTISTLERFESALVSTNIDFH